MAISIDYLTKIILVPRADLIELQNTPSFIYQLNMEWFYRRVSDLQDDQAGSPFVDAVVNTAPVDVGGVLLARVIQVINGYTVEFEDGQYAVNLTGANTNLQDVTQVNQVSVRPNNSAGLQDLSVLLQAAYGNSVAVDVINGQSGTVIPVGTRGVPSNNFADAVQIMRNNSLQKIQLMGSATLAGVHLPEGSIINGDNTSTINLTVDPSAETDSCEFTNLILEGTLDGGNTFKGCIIKDINYVNGFLIGCAIEGTVTLGGQTKASIMDCWSNIAGGGIGETPTIDMGGSGNSLVVRNFSGGVLVKNCTGGGGSTSMDFASGRAIFDSTIAAGTFYVRGVCNITNESIGTALIVDQTNSAMVWNEDKALTVSRFTTMKGVSELDKEDIAEKVWDEVL